MKRGQASIEFLVYAVIFTIALSAAFIMISSLSYSHVVLSQRALATALAERVANVFTLISSAPDGAYYYISLPPTLGNMEYEVKVKHLQDGNFVEVVYGENSVMALFHGNVVVKCPMTGGKELMLKKVYNTVEVVCP